MTSTMGLLWKNHTPGVGREINTLKLLFWVQVLAYSFKSIFYCKRSYCDEILGREGLMTCNVATDTLPPKL